MLAAYKYYIFAVILFGWSVGIWQISHKVTAYSYDKERLQLQTQILQATEQRQQLADTIGKQLQDVQDKLNLLNKDLTRKLTNDLSKAPVYMECRNTPDVVLDIEQAIDNQRLSSHK